MRRGGANTSAQIYQIGNVVGRKFYYPVHNRWAKMDTMWMFPNQWVRSCLALKTLSGSVQWVARGELVDNGTLPGISKNVPTNLSSKVILGTFYKTADSWWEPSSNKVTKLEIFSSALTVEKMLKYTKGEGCGDEGDYLSWTEMQWNFHGGAKIEQMETEETCTMQPYNFYSALFEWKSL